MNNGLKVRLARAIHNDNSILSNPTKLTEAIGYSLEYLESLGLEKRDLIRLERIGKAIRGRLPTKAGHVLRWVILDAKETTDDSTTMQAV
jgi:hypothetical protein